MSAANKVRMAAVVFVALALLTQGNVHATDERRYCEESSQATSLYHGNAEYVHRVLASARSDEQKVVALRRVFHLGMSMEEVHDILGMASSMGLTGSTIWATYGFNRPAFKSLTAGPRELKISS